jgi:hypothetical protein
MRPVNADKMVNVTTPATFTSNPVTSQIANIASAHITDRRMVTDWDKLAKIVRGGLLALLGHALAIAA